MLESVKYMEEMPYVGRFGIKYLDDKIKGIGAGNLILIGARTGAGKSTIANMIALANSDKKVGMFSLENFAKDDFMKEVFYKYKSMTQDRDLNLMDFKHGKYLKQGVLNMDFLAKAEAEAKDECKHINLVSRQVKYNVTKLREDMTKMCEDGVRLIILDHLDYVEQDDLNDNANKHITELMSEIRQLQDIYKCGIVAVSHFRKDSNSKNAPVIPGIDEFHGSSNKAKQATCAIMLAPDLESRFEEPDNEYKKTFCCIRKHRDLSDDNTVGHLSFNVHTGKYSDKYKQVVVSYDGKEVRDV